MHIEEEARARGHTRAEVQRASEPRVTSSQVTNAAGSASAAALAPNQLTGCPVEGRQVRDRQTERRRRSASSSCTDLRQPPSAAIRAWVCLPGVGGQSKGHVCSQIQSELRTSTVGSTGGRWLNTHTPDSRARSTTQTCALKVKPELDCLCQMSLFSWTAKIASAHVT